MPAHNDDVGETLPPPPPGYVEYERSAAPTSERTSSAWIAAGIMTLVEALVSGGVFLIARAWLMVPEDDEWHADTAVLLPVVIGSSISAALLLAGAIGVLVHKAWGGRLVLVVNVVLSMLCVGIGLWTNLLPLGLPCLAWSAVVCTLCVRPSTRAAVR